MKNKEVVIRIYDNNAEELLISFADNFTGFVEWLRTQWDGQDICIEQEIKWYERQF